MRRVACCVAGRWLLCSTLLCIGTCALWVRSYFADDWFSYVRQADTDTRLWHRTRTVTSTRGTLTVAVSTVTQAWSPRIRETSSKPGRTAPGFHYTAWTLPSPRPTTLGTGTAREFLGKLGFSALTEVVADRSGRNETTEYTLPHWAVVVPAAAPPAAQLLAWRRRRRAARRHGAGLCVRCAYDLRHSSERCPECGTVIPAHVPDAVAPTVVLRRAGLALAVAAVAATGWWGYGWWTSRQTWARLARSTTPIAHFTFENYDESDDTGFGAQLERINAPIVNGAMALNGVYEHGPGGESASRGRVSVPYLNFESFTVTWRFKCRPEMLTTPKMAMGQWNLLTGGGGDRWISLSCRPDGRVYIHFNNGQDFAQQIAGVQLKPDVLYRAAVSVDVKRPRVLVMFDRQPPTEIVLPPGFAFQVDPWRADREREFMFTNYSNGQTFAGEVDDFTVFSRAFCAEELPKQVSPP